MSVIQEIRVFYVYVNYIRGLYVFTVLRMFSHNVASGRNARHWQTSLERAISYRFPTYSQGLHVVRLYRRSKNCAPIALFRVQHQLVMIMTMMMQMQYNAYSALKL